MISSHTRAAAAAARCSACHGWGFDLDVVPMRPCQVCAGTGRAAGASAEGTRFLGVDRDANRG